MADKSSDDYEAYGGVKRLRPNIEPLEKTSQGPPALIVDQALGNSQ
jgi:hypothetical protein